LEEGSAERRGVQIPGGRANLRDGLVGGFEEFLGEQDPGLVDIAIDAGMSGGLEPPGQVRGLTPNSLARESDRIGELR
jgi:hypothetical protein